MARSLFCGTQRKSKHSAFWGIRSDPQPSIMGFDYRPADRQTHPHAARFGGKERIEYALHILGVDPWSGIGN
jgi:hypothetical protein